MSMEAASVVLVKSVFRLGNIDSLNQQVFSKISNSKISFKVSD